MQLSHDKNFYRQLAALSIPIFLQQLLRISVDTVNSLMLGSIDQLQMSAISQANQVFFIYYTVCSGLSVGCAVLVAQFWGKKDVNVIPSIIAHALRLVAVIGLIVSMAVHFFPETFMRIYSSDPDIIRIGAGYLHKVSLMYLACGLSVIIFAASRGVEQVRIVLITNIISYSINILLDYVLLFGKLGFPQLGVDGVAYGTIAARYVEFAVCLTCFIANKHIPFRISDIGRVSPNIRRALLKISAPIVAHEIVWSLGTSSGAMITGQLGKTVVAGYNVTTVLYDLCATVGNGFSSACSVVMGMTLGRGDLEEAKHQANSILLLALCFGLTLGVITFSVKDTFISLYALSDASRSYARQFMTVISIIWPFSLLEMVGMIAILRSGGEGKVGFYTDIVVMWMICIPLAALLAFRLHGEPWMIVTAIKAIIVLESVTGIINVYRYRWLRNLTGV